MYRYILILVLLSVNVLGKLDLDGDILLSDGVKLVAIPVPNDLEDESRGFGENSLLFQLSKFIRGHELRVSLPNLVEKDKLNQVLGEGLKALDESNNAVQGRGKGGGGAGAALLGLLFAKTLGAIGIGALALLTLKALGLAALALVLSALVGAKKMASHDDHDEHKVIYAGHHEHHRRRRDAELPLPYRAWQALYKVQ